MLTGFKDLKCALVGNIPTRAFSARLHALVADYSYEYEQTDDLPSLEKIIKDESYAAYTVTYPFKEAVIPYLDEISDTARRVRSVNTVIRRDGRLYGYNTDAASFTALLQKNRIEPAGKKVIVLGSGATSRAVSASLADAGAADVVVISRHGEDDYASLDLHDDAAIIVNTTPVGEAPHFGDSPIGLFGFDSLETVIDVIYDPFRTELLLLAEQNGIGAVGGYDMLLYHTKMTCELITGKKLSGIATLRAGASFEADIKNIVLVGMPGCGKSVIAEELGKMLSRPVYDTDTEVRHAEGLEIAEIYELYGEDRFRIREEEVIRNVSRGTGAVIACGAGAILRVENIKELRRKSTVVFLLRDTDKLETSRFSSAEGALAKIYEERLPLYLAAADITVEVGETPKDTAKAIVKALYKR